MQQKKKVVCQFSFTPCVEENCAGKLQEWSSDLQELRSSVSPSHLPSMHRRKLFHVLNLSSISLPHWGNSTPFSRLLFQPLSETRGRQQQVTTFPVIFPIDFLEKLTEKIVGCLAISRKCEHERNHVTACDCREVLW